MSQSTDAYAVANGSGATVRAAINADLQALNSNNSGASAPSSTVAGQWWVDTTTGWLKQRDTANASWIKVRKLNGDAFVDVASASTCDIGSDGSHNINITGTVTITSLGTSAPASDQPYFVKFAGALTLTHDGTALILPGAANIVTAAGDSMLAVPLGSGNWKVLDFSRASGQAIVGGKVGQVVNTETGAASTGTTVIPADDTIPQNTEGDQYMSLSITPLNASSTLVIEAVVNASNSNAGTNLITAALFQDATAGALAVAAARAPSGANLACVTLRHKMTAGTTSATTFKIRAGGDKAGTTTFNGELGNRLFGGTIASSITITEILP